MASAGSAAAMLSPVGEAGPARRLALLGAALELGAAQVMERRLGELDEPYRVGRVRVLRRAALGLTLAGGIALATAGRRSRVVALGGGAVTLAGAACERWAILEAGRESARDPKYTVAPQRRRLEERGRAAAGSVA